MKRHYIPYLASAALIVTAWPLQANALNALFLGRGPVGQMNRSDVKIARAEMAKSLNEAPDGQTHTWSNTDNSASGTITPTRSFIKNQLRCRSADITLYAKGKRDASTWTLCKTKGGWKIAS